MDALCGRLWQVTVVFQWMCFMDALLRPLKVVLDGFGVARSLFIAFLEVLRS